MFSWKWYHLSLSALATSLALRGDSVYREIPSLPPARDAGALPPLSIIVPARNEAQNLSRLLPSLTGLRYPGCCQVIVVDDGSTDGTADVARAYGACVEPVTSLTPGWMGKPHACHRGASVATGEWLLFTDADTTHAPDSATRTVSYAVANELDGISLLPQQNTEGVLDGVVLLVAFAGLFASLKRSSPILNGQYLLLHRDVYERSGGFSAVCTQPIEDVALGFLLREQGYLVPLVEGKDVVQVWMYRDVKQLWQGIMRLGSDSLAWSGIGAVASILLITGVMAPLLSLMMVLTQRARWKWAFANWAAAMPGLYPWGRRLGIGWRLILAPFGAAFVQLAACQGLLKRITGRKIRWKNRLV